MTMKKVAERAGVSLTTVSLVLNGKGNRSRVAEDTITKVLAVARELNYTKLHVRRKKMHDNFLKGELNGFAEWLIDSSYRIPDGSMLMFYDKDNQKYVTANAVTTRYLDWRGTKK